jgi:hypothetical protein
MNEAIRERMHGRVILSSLSGLDVLYHRKPSVETRGYGQACHDIKPFRRWALSVGRSTFSSVPAYAKATARQANKNIQPGFVAGIGDAGGKKT